ncbi:MAG: hypothetical protein HFE84_01235 [Lachnospiraceae bacterium]|nr:hypothetical protein [Lachnospiraceae bacterium]
MRNLKKTAAVLLAAAMSVTVAGPALAETTAEVAGIETYGGDLSAKTYDGIEFSVENLGVSEMALGSIINPASNGLTAQRILEKKRFYDNGTDAQWLDEAQKKAVEAFVADWKAAHINGQMSEEEIFRAIYDHLTQTVTYDKASANSQSSYGALIEKRCICGGYANAFMTLAKACGLEVKYVLTADHAFNLVRVSGTWYATDTTQNMFKRNSTAGAYYMHTTPAVDTSLTEKVERINERNRNKGKKIDSENAKYQAAIETAFADDAIFHMDNTHLVDTMLDGIVARIDPGERSQRIYLILYTDGKSYREFYEYQISYNGMQDKLHHIIAENLRGMEVGQKTIKDTSSCNFRYSKELGEDGMQTIRSLWTDEAGADFAIVDCQIYLQ